MYTKGQIYIYFTEGLVTFPSAWNTSLSSSKEGNQKLPLPTQCEWAFFY